MDQRAWIISVGAAAIVVVVIATVIWIYIGDRNRIKETIDVTTSMKDKLFVNWLRSYEAWYDVSAKNWNRVLIFCRVAPIIIGFMIAVVSAVDPNIVIIPGLRNNLIVIILSGISTVCLTIITQFSVVDLAKAREIGRINCAKLVVEAMLSIEPENKDELNRLKQKLAEEIFDIESVQAKSFSDAFGKENKAAEDEAAKAEAAEAKAAEAKAAEAKAAAAKAAEADQDDSKQTP